MVLPPPVVLLDVLIVLQVLVAAVAGADALSRPHKVRRPESLERGVARVGTIKELFTLIGFQYVRRVDQCLVIILLYDVASSAPVYVVPGVVVGEVHHAVGSLEGLHQASPSSESRPGDKVACKGAQCHVMGIYRRSISTKFL